MLHLIICDDELAQRNYIEKIATEHMIAHDFHVTLSLSTPCPQEVLAHIENHKNEPRLYFLDVDLQNDISGIDLAIEIRKQDPFSSIVFITSQQNLAHLLFHHKLEAMDYIVKDFSPDEVQERIKGCISLAYSFFQNDSGSSQKRFLLDIGDQLINVPYHEILFFETNTHLRNKILLHKENARIEFYGTLHDIVALGAPFSLCHRSFVVNVNHITQVDKANRKLEMANGSSIPISARKMKDFLHSIDSMQEK